VARALALVRITRRRRQPRHRPRLLRQGGELPETFSSPLSRSTPSRCPAPAAGRPRHFGDQVVRGSRAAGSCRRPAIRRKPRLSASSACAPSGTLPSSSLTTSIRRASICFQSAVTARTSPSTRSMPAASRARASGSTSRSTSDVHPRLARRLRPVAARPQPGQRARRSRSTAYTGARGRCIVSPGGSPPSSPVDEERHVVVDDLDHGVPHRPAVLRRGRAEHPHAGGARGRHAAELPVRQRRAGQVVGAARGQIVGVDLPGSTRG